MSLETASIIAYGLIGMFVAAAYYYIMPVDQPDEVNTVMAGLALALIWPVFVLLFLLALPFYGLHRLVRWLS